MDPTKVLALVLAGGNGTRLHPLTAQHAKPALPLAAGYRIVDFVLSNLVNSGISSIYVLAQYKPRSLIEHIRTAWAPWRDGERFIKVVLPEADSEAGSFKGTSDADASAAAGFSGKTYDFNTDGSLDFADSSGGCASVWKTEDSGLTVYIVLSKLAAF